MKILVTGALGAIGSRLVPELCKRGYEVSSCDLRRLAVLNEIMFSKEKLDALYMRCDVAEFRQLERVIEIAQPDLVYHLAAEAGRWNGEDFYENLWRTNAVGAKNIIRLQERNGFRLIFFSTSEIYGNLDQVLIESLTEERAVFPLCDYAISKWAGELQVRNSAKQFGTESVIVRPFNIYGPGEYYSPYRSVNSLFLFSALHGLPFVVYKGHARTSTYIDDMVRTLANIAERFRPGEIYNIAGDNLHTIEQLAEIALRVTGADPGLASYVDQPEQMTVMVKRVSIEKAQRDLDHRITVNLSEGMARTANWMREVYEDHARCGGQA